MLRIVIGADGTIHEATDLAADRVLLTERANQIWAYVDKPRGWDAWDVAETIEQQGEEIAASEPPTLVESGPLRVAIRVVRRWRSSTITQTYRLLAGSMLAALVAAVILKARDRVYRRIREREETDDDADGVPDVYQTRRSS